MTVDFLIFTILATLVGLWVYVVYREYYYDKKPKDIDRGNSTVPKNKHVLNETHLPRGTDSERNIVSTLIYQGILPELIYHNLYVPISINEYAQVDIIVLTKVGIIVIEDKDFSGWIFGNGYQSEWTQILAYGKEKNRFYNPIKQNYGHIKALKQSLIGIVDVPFFSVITFSPKCTFRNINNIPADTYVCYSNQLKSIIDKIIECNTPVSYGDNDKFTIMLNSYVSNGEDPRIVQLHRDTIRKIKLGYKKDVDQEFYNSI